jgi:ribosomal protein L7/L12
VESTPQPVGENLPFADAEALRTALEAAGAKVTLRKVA